MKVRIILCPDPEEAPTEEDLAVDHAEVLEAAHVAASEAAHMEDHVAVSGTDHLYITDHGPFSVADITVVAVAV